jgi:UDP-glucose 4-epimerase
VKLFITGVSGYLGGLVVEALDKDPSIESMVGIDLAMPRVCPSKLEFHGIDVRDPGIRDLMRGCDAVLHMAFILNEIKDKARTYDININGSKNVFQACLDTGVPWLIQLSSMAAFGPHPDNPLPLTEEDYPRGHPGCYYCYSKAELEHYLSHLQREHPEMEVTVLRPTVVIGNGIDNTITWMFQGKFAARIKGHDACGQFIHEQDLVDAIRLVIDRHLLGIYHVTSDDYMTVSEMIERVGITAPSIPKRVLELMADISFAMGTSPISGHWVRMFSESMVGTSEKLKAEGWSPSYSSSELFDKYVVEPMAKR